jgi:hypothetical protein
MLPFTLEEDCPAGLPEVSSVFAAKNCTGTAEPLSATTFTGSMVITSITHSSSLKTRFCVIFIFYDLLALDYDKQSSVDFISFSLILA